MNPIDPLEIPSCSLALTLSGPIDNYEFLEPRIKAHANHIAVDGGLNHLKRFGIKPDVWIGDADSVDQDFEPENAPFKCELHPVDKDRSDFFLALEYAKRYFNFERVTIFGGFGNRIDHTLSNLYSAATASLPIFFETEEETTFFCEDLVSFKAKERQTISIMPLTPCVKVSSRGLKWELMSKHLSPSYFSLSNTARSDHISISKEEGLLAITLRTAKF